MKIELAIDKLSPEIQEEIRNMDEGMLMALEATNGKVEMFEKVNGEMELYQQEPDQLTKYGHMALKYWQEEKPEELLDMTMSEEGLMPFFLEIEKRATEMFHQLLAKMMEEEPNTGDFMKDLQKNQRIYDQAEEIVLQEVVYN